MEKHYSAELRTEETPTTHFHDADDTEMGNIAAQIGEELLRQLARAVGDADVGPVVFHPERIDGEHAHG